MDNTNMPEPNSRKMGMDENGLKQKRRWRCGHPKAFAIMAIVSTQPFGFFIGLFSISQSSSLCSFEAGNICPNPCINPLFKFEIIARGRFRKIPPHRWGDPTAMHRPSNTRIVEKMIP
jgi:hypothetical protein